MCPLVMMRLEQWRFLLVKAMVLEKGGFDGICGCCHTVVIRVDIVNKV